MSALLTLDSLSVATPDGRVLFDGLTLAVGRERIGLAGRNGSGKSSLLRVIAGEAEPRAGKVHRAGRIGMLRQTLDDRETVAQALGVADLIARLRRLEAGQGSPGDAAEADWTLEPRLAAALDEVGLGGPQLDRSVASLSGGERTRTAIARLSIEGPDMLLLDEPTNNLDADGRSAVARLVRNWRGGLIVASHDRALLEEVDRIVELAPSGVTIFGGGWTAFAAARDAERARADAELVRARSAARTAAREAQVAKERQDKRDKAGRAKRAKGDAPKLLLDARLAQAERTAARNRKVAGRLTGDSQERLNQARERVEIVTPLAMALPSVDLPAARELLTFRDVVMEQGKRRLFGPLSFGLRGPERIAVSGPNGAGKTTLLRLISGETAPASGEIQCFTSRIVLLDQHVTLLQPQETLAAFDGALIVVSHDVQFLKAIGVTREIAL
jgi:ATPase subunit of ABC transporter with duplicated ATPase domains